MPSAFTVNQLTVRLPTEQGWITPVDDVSFTIEPGHTLALVGESGCGKSMTANALMRLLPMSAVYRHGQVSVGGQDLLKLTEAQMQDWRGKRIGMIFQEPMTALNPVLTIGEQLSEVTDTDQLVLLQRVGIKDAAARLKQYPHQLSGGMKQRVVIALAIANRPEVLIADEPTTALDVTTQANILALLQDLQAEYGMALLLITHDLGVVRQVADDVAVMYAGHLIEQAECEAFFTQPCHPYSVQLLQALPDHNKRGQTLSVIQGQVPTLLQSFNRCRFLPRCQQAFGQCEKQAPSWFKSQKGQLVRCLLYADKNHVLSTEAKAGVHTKETTLSDQSVLAVNNLQVHYPIRAGMLRRVVRTVKAVDGVSLQVNRGQIVALVGESGCGKSTVAKSLLGLVPEASGDFLHRFDHQAVQMVFQDPYGSLNPRMLVGDIIAEGLKIHRRGDRRVWQKKVDELIEQVGLPSGSASRYPNEFSGGQRQRISIARALAVEPRVIICDEPTSALDASVQAKILNLLKSLQAQFQLSYLFISHDISVVGYLADEIAVMQAGKIVERGPAEQVLHAPRYAYTQALLAAVPSISDD